MSTDEPDRGPSLRTRVRRFWGRHRALFWTLHSVWALATGVVVIVLARERYGFVPWVVLFLALTWASTMFFGGRTRVGDPAEGEPDGDEGSGPEVPRVGVELTSYLTRTLYQETLFFLLPFYAYSVVVGAPTTFFLALLGALAVLSCLDLVFDRWLRRSPVFGLVFFATVAFAAINLLLPLLVQMDPERANAVAAVIAVGSAAPLVLRGASGRWRRARLLAAAVAVLALPVLFPSLVPPVPLRLDEATFARSVERGTLAIEGALEGPVTRDEAGPRLAVVLRIFAPGRVPTTVTLEWHRDGEALRTTREIDVVGHEGGFRVWDAWGPGGGSVPPGRYTVVIRTRSGAVFGRARLEVSGA